MVRVSIKIFIDRLDFAEILKSSSTHLGQYLHALILKLDMFGFVCVMASAWVPSSCMILLS